MLLPKFLLIKSLNFFIPFFLNDLYHVAFIFWLKYWHFNLDGVSICSCWSRLCLCSCNCALEGLFNDRLDRLLRSEVQSYRITSSHCHRSWCFDSRVLFSKSLSIDMSRTTGAILFLCRVWSDLLSRVDLVGQVLDLNSIDQVWHLCQVEEGQTRVFILELL